MVRPRPFLVFACCVAWFGSHDAQAQLRSDRVKGARPFQSSAQTVDLFEGLAHGTLRVNVIPRDSQECRVLIANRTQRDLNVRMPAALAAVPVLAQPAANGLAPGQDNSSMPQRLGVGNPFGQQNPIPMVGNMPGPAPINQVNQPFFAPFCVAAEKVAQLKLPAVCLDHGHPDPRPAMRYRLVSLATVSESKEVEMLCRQLGRDPASQRVAQAAAWHFRDGKTWEELEAMTIGRLARPDESLFTHDEIEKARGWAEAFRSAAALPAVQGQSSLAWAP